MTLAHVGIVVGAGKGLGDPFLLEEGPLVVSEVAHAREVVEIVFGPVLADFLEREISMIDVASEREMISYGPL